jgi:MFS family permease
VALGVTTIVSYGTTEYLFGVLVVPMGQELGWDRASLSGAYAVMLILAGLLGVPIGRLVDRYGARTLMALGSLLSGASLLAMTQVQALWQFYALWAGGLGLATALTYYPVTFTVVANWFDRRRGAALAILTLLGGLASPIFIPLAGVLVPRVGWRGALVVMALAQLAVALPLHALVVRRHPEDLGLRPDGHSVGAQDVQVRASTSASLDTRPGLTLHSALRQAPFWSLTTAFALASLATNVILVHTVAYLVGRGYAGEVAAGVAGAVGLTSLPGRFLLNRLSDRVGPQPLLGLALLFQALGVLLLLAGGALGVSWLIGYVVVYGAAYGAVSPLRAGVMADHVGRRAYGTITAIQGAAVALSAGLGPFAAGWLYDRLGGYGLSLGLCTAAFALAALGVLVTRRPHIQVHTAESAHMVIDATTVGPSAPD